MAVYEDGATPAPGQVAGVQVGSGNVQVNNYFYGGPMLADDPSASSLGVSASPGAAGAVSHDVFISYAGQDRAWVRELADALQRRGIRVAYDELVMQPGDVIVHTLDKAIRASASGLLVYSQASIASPWVDAEYAALMQNSIQNGQLFIPAIIEDVQLPPFAESRYSADFRQADAATFDRLVEKIARAVTRPLPITNGNRATRLLPAIYRVAVIVLVQQLRSHDETPRGLGTGPAVRQSDQA